MRSSVDKNKEVISFLKRYSILLIILSVLVVLLFSHFYGKYVNFIGTIVTIVGFPLALLGLWLNYEALKETNNMANMAVNAAQAAELAANEVRKEISSVIIVVNLATIEQVLQNIKHLHRSDKWELALEKYDQLNSMLVELRYLTLTSNDKQKLISCSEQMSVMGSEVEKYVQRKANTIIKKPDASRYNTIISAQMEKVREILGEHKQRVVKYDV